MHTELIQVKKSSCPAHETKKERIKYTRGLSKECQKVQIILDNFTPDLSEAYINLTNKFGRGVTHKECQKLAEVISLKLDIRLERQSKRRFSILIKWFNDNWDRIEPYFGSFSMTDKDDLDEISNDYL